MMVQAAGDQSVGVMRAVIKIVVVIVIAIVATTDAPVGMSCLVSSRLVCHALPNAQVLHLSQPAACPGSEVK